MKQRADLLLAQLKDATIALDCRPSLALSCHHERIVLQGTIYLNEREYFRHINAVAEIFRLSTEIYIHRILHGPWEPLTDEMQGIINEIFRLLGLVPDAVGPGCTLGWCLTIVGAEIDLVEQREYVAHRLRGIRILGLNNSESAEKVLLKVWEQRDMRDQGFQELQRWQDIMRNMGEGQILV